MYSDEAIKLLKELKRNNDRLKQYNNDSIRAVTSEVVSLHNQGIQLLRQLSESQENDFSGLQKAKINVAAESIKRNKQCLLTYHHHRMKHIERLVWQNRAEGGGRKLPQKSIQNLLSQDEIQFYLEYCKLIHNYNLNFDLMGSNVPPTSLMIRVRAVKDLSYETEDGTYRILKVGHEDYMKRSEVEKYIEQGYLIHI